MNNINSINEYVTAVSEIFAELNSLGDISLPCRYPQPWNNSNFQPQFTAERVMSNVPNWSFSCRPLFNQTGAIMRFAGLKLSVHVSDATMHGSNHFVQVPSFDQAAAAIAELVEFRDRQLTACQHHNHHHFANLGRCYNRYKCNDCGVTFDIDSGD